MAYAAPDAAQNGTPAITNGDSRQNGHNGHPQPNGPSNPGSHGEGSILAVTMDGGRIAQPDKGKEPEHFGQAMEIDEPDPRPVPFSLDFGPEVHHPHLDDSHDAGPDRAAKLIASVDEDEEPDWDTIEDNWNSETQAIRDEEDAALDQALETEEKPLKDQCKKAVDNYNRIYQDLLQARIEIDGLVANRDCIFARFERIQIDRDNERAVNDLRVRSWIAKGRREAAEAAARRQEEANKRRSAYVRDSDHGMPAIFNERLRGLIEHDGQNNNGRSSSRQRLADQATSTHGSQAQSGGQYSLEGLPWDGTHPGFEPKRITDVTSATGVKVGVLLSIPLVNHWIDSLMRFPVLRDVVIRLGRKFTAAHLLAIYQGPDQKQSKWLSFMIQATGQQQDTACQTCAKGQGLFSACIIVGGPDFPRCGNCEWNKHGCHGAVGETNAVLPDFHGQARSQNRPRTDEDEHPKVSTISKPPLSLKPAHFNYKKSVARFTKAMKLAEPPKPPAPSQAVIDLEQPNQSPATGPKTGKPPKTGKNGSAPARGNGRRQKSNSGSTPGNKRPSTPNNGDQSFSKGMSPFDVTEEITEDTLALRHDNMVYFAPELMSGVPRRKISPDHAYWDSSWKSLETYVQNKHDEWVSKVTALKAIPEANLTDKDRTAIFQAGRQINRGKTILKYLGNCDSHPYQLVAKSFLTTSSTHYDTLYRMVATIEELGKFRLSVTPVDWLRQRLHEIHREKGDAFKLDKVLAKLYHDPKLSYLRSKNGFGNIGRPSVFTRGGANGVEGSGGDGTQSSVSKRRSEKRRQQPDSTTSTPTRRAFTEADQEAAADSAPQNKRRKKAADPAVATAALAPASATASKRASRPAIPSQASKNSDRNGTLSTSLSSHVISMSPGPFGGSVSDNGSALSTPASSCASRDASRGNQRAINDADGSRPASRNIGQFDGADDSMDNSHDTSREYGANDSQIGPIESHHISHNYGGYTSSEDEDGDDNDSDAAPRGRNRTRNGSRSNSRNANANRRSRASRTSRATPNEELDLDYSGYTSRDSLTDDVVVNKDWRVLQVKTLDLTSNGHTTQYWHWVDEQHAYQTSGPGGPSDFDPMFEHQVLKETEPATSWGVFREPINFHLRLRELTGIRYATGSKVIAIGTKAMPDFAHRGDVLALFKRERTKRRFLVFMKKKGVALHKVSRDEIEGDWESFSKSQLMPGNESD